MGLEVIDKTNDTLLIRDKDNKFAESIICVHKPFWVDKLFNFKSRTEDTNIFPDDLTIIKFTYISNGKDIYIMMVSDVIHTIRKLVLHFKEPSSIFGIHGRGFDFYCLKEKKDIPQKMKDRIVKEAI